MSQKIIQIDVDGVCAEFVLGYTTLIHDRFEGCKPFGTKQQKTWEFDCYTPDQEDQAWNYIKQDPYWWEGLELLDGFREALDHPVLVDPDHFRIYFVTLWKPGNATEGGILITLKKRCVVFSLMQWGYFTRS